MKPVQQNRFADASEAEQHHSLGGPPVKHAVHVNRRVFEELVSSSKFRRLQPSSWRIWVFSAIHARDYIKISYVNKRLINITNANKVNEKHRFALDWHYGLSLG
jgi:hypothetical protein